jgi:hypothetical protein
MSSRYDRFCLLPHVLDSVLTGILSGQIVISRATLYISDCTNAICRWD